MPILCGDYGVGMANFTISTDIDRIDLDLVHHWLSTDAFWALGRSRQTVELAARASINFGAYDADGHQVGYARVVTDQVTFAWLCDVYVPRESRGRGIGVKLAKAVVANLRPMHLNRVLLSTLNAHGVYEKVGFVAFPDPEKLMVLDSGRPSN